MNPDTLNRLQGLREANDEHGALMAALRPRFDRLANRHENGTAPRAVSAFQLFQTPPAAAALLVSRLYLEPGARILEPSAGLGRILDALQPFAPSEVVAVESAAACAGELFRQERQGVTIKQRDFLTVTPADIGLFDAVAMNPPFHLRADIRHILHARSFLKPGGRLSAICFDTKHRRDALKPIAASWEELPPDLFAKEGAHVRTALVVIENH